MREQFGEYLLKLTQADSKVIVIDGDLANSTKTNYVAENNPNQFIQCGIAEQSMVGIAAGLATTGLQPWVCTFASFLTKRALDQIIVSVAQPKLNVKLIGCYSGILNSKLGKTHQAIEDIAIMRAIPNMIILSPADKNELKESMRFAYKCNGPFYIRLARESKNLFTPSYNFNQYYGNELYKGEDLTIISTGTHTYYAEQAVLKLKEEHNINAKLIHIPMIKPIDKDIIIKAALTTKGIVTVEDHSIIGGLGSTVAEILSENCPTKLIRIGINDVNIESGDDKSLLEKYELTINDIYRAAIKLLITII